MFRLYTSRSAILLAILMLASCSSSDIERVSVSGMVNLDGAPLDEGIITFVPLNGGPTAAAPIEMGEYNLAMDSGPSPGEHRVQIVAFRDSDDASSKPVGSGLTDPTESNPKSAGLGGADDTNQTQYIPPRYNTQSDLTSELQSGKNQNVDFELESDP